MDPNATLSEIRALNARILDSADSSFDVAWRLAELVEALDDWLKSGGCLPADWKPLPKS